MIEEKLKLKGTMLATIVRANGEVEVMRKDNLIVDVGYAFICNAIGDDTGTRPSAMSHIAIGTDGTDPAANQTQLLDESARGEATYTPPSGGGSSPQFKFDATFGPGVGTGEVKEAGVFNNATANQGIMFDRVNFNVINKGSDDSLKIEFTFSINPQS